MARAFFFANSIIGARPADQAFARRFAEGQAELDAGHGVDQRFMDILNRLDEMRLAEDEVNGFRLLDLNCGEFDFHSNRMFAPPQGPVKPAPTSCSGAGAS
jgi:hypothetical protein